MTKRLIPIVIALAIMFTPRASRADLFGGDVAMLANILAQALVQYQKIKEIYKTGKDNVDLLRDINKGINECLYLAKTIDPNFDPGLYEDWVQVEGALSNLETIYGKVPVSANALAQKHADQAVAEAITDANRYYEHSKKHDELSEQIKTASRNRSPGGAQKLTAESQGLLIQGQNENLRAQADANKINAIRLSNETKQRKDRIKDRQQIGTDIVDAFDKLKDKRHFDLPNF